MLLAASAGRIVPPDRLDVGVTRSAVVVLVEAHGTPLLDRIGRVDVVGNTLGAVGFVVDDVLLLLDRVGLRRLDGTGIGRAIGRPDVLAVVGSDVAVGNGRPPARSARSSDYSGQRLRDLRPWEPRLTGWNPRAWNAQPRDTVGEVETGTT